MTGVGAVIGTKGENYKESFQILQENELQYVVANHKKGVDLSPLIRKLEDVDLSSKEPGPPTGHRSKGSSNISKKRYEIQLKIMWLVYIPWKIT